MSELVRLSMSIEKGLHDRMENLVQKRGYENRSEFLRDLIRESLVNEEWQEGKEAVATITLVYDHHVRRLNEKLTDLQHDYHHEILATTHVHLDHDLCAEMILAKGDATIIRELADKMKKQKGVLHAGISLSSTGKNLT